MKDRPRSPRPHAPDWLQDLESQFEEIEFFRHANLNPLEVISNQMLAGLGTELPAALVQENYRQAMLTLARRKHFQPDPPGEATALFLGTSVETGAPIHLAVHRPFRLVAGGASGTGKTNLAFRLIYHLIFHQPVLVLAYEYKPELRRVIPVWRNAILFTPRNAPWQFLNPVGNDPLAYFIALLSEIRLEFELRPETVPLLWTILERMLRGMKPGDPPFCWEDLRRVIEHEAIAQKRDNLLTASRAFLNICTVLGPQATARVVPEIPDQYRLIGYDFVGQDPALLRLFLAFDFIRLLFQAQREGPTAEFRRFYVFDEGSVLFSSELMNRGVAHISAAKRFVSMCRSTGTGFLIGVQNPSQVDPFVLQNCDVFAFFRCASVVDAELAAQMLGLPSTAIDDLMHLPVGICYLRAAEWEQAVKIRVPMFTP